MEVLRATDSGHAGHSALWTEAAGAVSTPFASEYWTCSGQALVTQDTPDAPRAVGKRSYNPFEWDESQDIVPVAEKAMRTGLVAWQKRQQKPCAPGIQNAPASAMLQDVCAYLSIRTNKETGSPTGAPKPAPAASMVLASSDAHVWPATPNRDAISEPSLCAWPAAAMVPPSLLLDSKDACASTPAPVRSTSLFDQMSTCPVPGPITPAERAPRPLVRAMSGPLADVWEPWLDGMCVKAPRQAVRIPAPGPLAVTAE